MNIRFARLEKSEMLKSAIKDKLNPVLNKFKVSSSDIKLDVEMLNSPHQAGRDLYKVKLKIIKGRLRGFIMEKSDMNFYRALSLITASLPANFKRFGEKKRSQGTTEQRKLKNVYQFQRTATDAQ